MRLHRLVLAHYRGINHRDIEFPDHGVIVVTGPNEVGKTSMIEALDLLLEARDRSARRDVKQVKPTHADVGAEVTAEISTGPYRFVYRKRFHKKPETELTVLAPRREQLTGDEAHDRVTAILAETVDTELWRAQRVLQAGSTDAADLSGCDALSRALDIAASESATLTGDEPILIEGIDQEYLNYFTPTGRPTGVWAAAKADLIEAEREKSRCAAAVTEVHERVTRHAELTEQLAEVYRQRVAIDARHIAAQSAADRVVALTAALSAARLRATAAAATRAVSMAAHIERIRLSDDATTRSAALTELQAQAAQAADEAATAGAASSAADVAAIEGAELLAAAEQRVESARSVVERLSARVEADRLAARLDRIDAIERDRARLTAELAAITMTPQMLRAVEDAATAVELADARLSAISATVQVIAASDVELAVGDQQVALATGGSWSTTAPTEINVPGVLTVRVSPGITTLAAHDKRAVAQTDLSTALAAAAVPDLAAARTVERHRLELRTCRDQLNATLTGLCDDGEQADALRNRLAQLRAGQLDPADVTGIDATAAPAELDSAEAARVQAAVNCVEHRNAAAAAAAQLVEKSTRATVLAANAANQQTELMSVTDRLAAQRVSVTDEALAATADADAQAVQAAELAVIELSDQLAAADPDAVAAELAAAAAGSAALRTQRDEIERALRDVVAQLSVLGTEGRQSKLDAAEATYQHAAAEHARIGRRARAAQLLRSVILRHRDDTRQRYVEPFRSEIQRLGRPVFGDSFEVEVDSGLRIRNRTLDGRTVPYESISGGAKEQLGILARLAGAVLVAKEDAVPVLIDDALGFTDPARLASMGALFDAVGAHGQVIVLTCTPDRYQGVQGAHRIDLTATRGRG